MSIIRAEIKVKRIYEPKKRGDGYRVLVDRLWPRGVSKEKANVDLWIKEIAPSTELRKWFNHEPKRWAEFQRRYRRQLVTEDSTVSLLKSILNEKEIVTLLFSASDTHYNNATALQKILHL